MLTKSIALILSVFILSQSFNVHLMDVLKLNNLLNHIELHESTYGDDIFSFISKHYGDEMAEHKKQKDNRSDHQKLPFKQGICSGVGHLFIFEPDAERLVYTDTSDVKKTVYYYCNFYFFLENTDIFQPPRIA